MIYLGPSSSPVLIDKHTLEDFSLFQDCVNKNKYTPTELLEYLNDNLSTSKLDFNAHNEIIKKIKHIEKDILYNNSAQSIQLKIFQLLTTYQ